MNPTFQALPSFDRDVSALTPDQRARLSVAVSRLVKDLRNGKGLRPGLRVKRVAGTSQVWEMTFAPDGRATFQYGSEIKPGQPHIIWRRVGTHQVLDRP